MVGAMEAEGQVGVEYFPNPTLQHGSNDMGHGWTEFEPVEDPYNYEQQPEGMYVFSENQAHF